MVVLEGLEMLVVDGGGGVIDKMCGKERDVGE